VRRGGPAGLQPKPAGAGAGIHAGPSPSTSVDNHGCCGDAERACCRRACASHPTARRFGAPFPDPAVNYRTPAFDNGRTAFTSNAEFSSCLPRPRAACGADGTWVTVMSARLFRRNERGTGGAGVPRSTDRRHRRCCIKRPPYRVVDRAATWRRPAAAKRSWCWPQELARGKLQKPARTHQCGDLPRANPDGAQAVQRATRSGVDANRDHLLLKTPRRRPRPAGCASFQPLVIVDAQRVPVVALPGEVLAASNGMTRCCRSR